MTKLATLLNRKAENCFTTDIEIAMVLGPETSADKRYGLVKRAMASGDLIRIKRGLYCLAEQYRKVPLDLFVVAQAIYPPSCISLHSALSFHGLIPEAVYTTTSISANRTRKFTTPLGIFEYHRVPQQVLTNGVSRVESDKNAFMIATPQKALLDLVYVSKSNWASVDALIADLRLDETVLQSFSQSSFDKLAPLYHSKRINDFVKILRLFYEH